MLNELLVVERGARQAGVEMTQRHPDIKDARRIPTLVIALNETGQVSAIRPAPVDVTPWTLRDVDVHSSQWSAQREAAGGRDVFAVWPISAGARGAVRRLPAAAGCPADNLPAGEGCGCREAAGNGCGRSTASASLPQARAVV